MSKYFFKGMLEGALFLLPVPLFLGLLSLLVPRGLAFFLSLILAFLIIQRFALPLFNKGTQRRR